MLPESLLDHLQNAPGFNRETFVAIHNSGDRVVSIRTNPAKWSGPAGLSFPTPERIPWTSDGYYLAERPFFTFEPWLHAGVFYVQEASSMFLEQVLRQCLDMDKPVTALDGCAAPGGKSTLLQAYLPTGSVLVSNEVIKTRVHVLEENLVKWGGGNNIITNSDPREFAKIGALFDLLVVDAPCSGTGLFRRDPEAISEWSTDLVKLCNQRQQRILADYWDCLKEDAVLIYSTCSYCVEEDEAIADWLMEEFDAASIPITLHPEWNIVHTVSLQKSAHGYRFFPDKLRGEGFYIAAFRKKSGQASRRTDNKSKWESVPKKSIDLILPWVRTDQELRFISVNDNVLAITPSLEKTMLAMQGIYIRSAGVTMGKIAGRDLIPAHPLALSQWLPDAIPDIDLDRQTALQYLRKEEIHPEAAEKGWALVRYEKKALGWIKILGNRSNNYYPREWRILKPA